MTAYRNRKVGIRFFVILLMLCCVFCGVAFSETTFATNSCWLNELSQFATLSQSDLDMYSQNNITFYDPTECISRESVSTSGSLVGTGEFADIYNAKNADGYLFNGNGTVPNAHWYDGNNAEMKRLLETYGDLAYRTGRAVGVPYVGILVQMRYEDYNSVCGANNFWGNGCYGSHTGAGQALIQGKNLGEGFVQYAETITNGYHDKALGLSDPKEFLRALAVTWIGTGMIYNMEKSVDALQAYIDSPEGQEIVKTFGGGEGVSVSPVSSGSINSISGSDITWIGDSYSVGARSIIEEKFPGISFGGSVENANSYIQSNKFVDTDNVGGVANPSALTVLQRIVDAGELKPYLVMAVGTNGGWTDEMVEKFEGIMSSHSDVKVVFVTAKAKAHLMSDDNGTNQRLEKLTGNNSNYILADWANKGYDDKYFEDNSTHPTANGGYEKWVDVIADALNGAGVSSCTTYEGDYPQYLQCDAKWKNEKYGGSTMCNAGCGPASLAMLVTAATGKDVLPTDLAEITQGPGNCSYYNDSSPDCGSSFARVEYTKKVCEKYGCEVKQLPDNSVETIRQALKDGWMIHLSGGAASDAPEASLSTHDTATNPFMTTGHFVGIFKIDNDDKVMVADPAGDAKPGYPGRFNREMTLEQATANRWYNKPIMAIRGSGGNSGKNTCEVAGNYCAAEGSGGGSSSVSGEIGEFGLTYEQAVQFMKNYGKNVNNASKKAVDKTNTGQWYIDCHGNNSAKGLGGSNCTTFSVFFMNKFTDAKSCVGGPCGHGYEILSHVNNIDVDKEPAVWSVFSYKPIHTGVILGHHDGQWIVGHASCSNYGAGEGTGEITGAWPHFSTGSGFVKRASTWQQAVSLGDMTSLVGFGHPKNVDVGAIKTFIETGE